MKTRSGRTIKKPIRYDTMQFVKGSGPGGDHYDRGYNRGVFFDPEKLAKEYLEYESEYETDYETESDQSESDSDSDSEHSESDYETESDQSESDYDNN